MIPMAMPMLIKLSANADGRTGAFMDEAPGTAAGIDDKATQTASTNNSGTIRQYEDEIQDREVLS